MKLHELEELLDYQDLQAQRRAGRLVGGLAWAIIVAVTVAAFLLWRF